LVVQLRTQSNATLCLEGLKIDSSSFWACAEMRAFVQMGGSYFPPNVASQHYAAYCESLPSMEDKIVVITGTTSGIGLIAAKTAVTQGAQVIMLNRASERADAALQTVMSIATKRAGTRGVKQIECDLQNFASVKRAAERVLAEVASAGVDVLVNNAGELLSRHAAQAWITMLTRCHSVDIGIW
jgi:NADPH:quinone reductase-like Zn-dependent oxidoreductase